MKRIGILTQPLHNNYGGLLQNYALQQVLIQEGFLPVTIDHDEKRLPRLRVFFSEVKKKLIHLISPSKHPASIYIPNQKEFSIISRNSRCFIEKYIAHTVPFRSVKELNKLVKAGGFDGYVVGSDQCWRPIYSGGFLKEMFLDFIENETDVRKIAYAASFGTDKWEFSEQMTDVCARLSKKFDFISVREQSGVTLCKKYLGVDATHVLDPTMLLSKEDYINLVDNDKSPQSSGDLFYYILDPNKEKSIFVSRIAENNSLTPFTVLPKRQAENRTKDDIKRHIEDCIYPPVTSWLRGFMDAKMTVVDSFHGTVFSIIFNKPFWVIGNEERGNARFKSLLKLFDLEDRLVNSTELSSLDEKKQIDWERVNNLLVQWRGKSKNVFNYLK